jgi:hypothetical protein
MPVRVPDGTYTAKVELDGGPYLGKISSEKTIRIENR